jgi:hypothetical protein
MACSPLVALALKRNGLGIMLIGTAVFGVILALGLLFAHFGVQDHEKKDAGTAEPASPSVGLAITITLAAMFFIYVAMENGIGIWAAEYAKRLANGITSLTTLAPMFFYAGLTIGRATAPMVLLRLKERKIVLGALSLTAGATASGNRLGLSCGPGMRQRLSHFHSLVLAVVRITSEENWGDFVCPRVSRGIVGPGVDRSGLSILGQLASGLARPAGWRGSADSPGAVLAATDRSLRYS